MRKWKNKIIALLACHSHLASSYHLMSDDNEYPKIQGRNIKLLPVFAVLNHDLITPFRRCEVYVPVFLPSLEWGRKALQHDHSGDGMPSF